MKLDRNTLGVALLTLALLFVVAAVNRGYARGRAEAWLAMIAPDEKSPEHQLLVRGLQADSLERVRFRQQMGEVERHIAMHGEVMKQFYTAHFTAVTMATVCGVLATSLLIFVSIRGWTDTDSRVLAALVICAAGFAVFTAFSAVYQQAKNISDSKALRQAASTLRQEMLTFAATHRPVVPTAPAARDTSVTLMLRRIDGELAKIMSVSIGFDESKIPSTGSLDATRRAAGGT